MVAPVLMIGSAVFCAVSMISAAVGKKTSSHFSKFADVAGSGRVIPMSDTQTKILYIKQDTVDKKRVINVLDENKVRIYSFEKVKTKIPKKKKTWILVTANHRTVVGTVCLGKFKYLIEFPNKVDIPLRMVKNEKKLFSKYQYFRYHKQDSARYRWTRTSLVLDCVTAMEDPCKECKQRVAITRKLSAPSTKKEKLQKKKAIKTNKYVDYEIAYDTTLIDRELLIATAFVSIMTQWRKAKKSKSPTTISKKSKIMKIKRDTGMKFKKAAGTSAAITESKVNRNMRKVKIAKSIVAKFLGKKPVNTAEIYQENIALASTRNISSQQRGHMVIAPSAPACGPRPVSCSREEPSPAPPATGFYDDRGTQGGSCNFYS